MKSLLIVSVLLAALVTAGYAVMSGQLSPFCALGSTRAGAVVPNPACQMVCGEHSDYGESDVAAQPGAVPGSLVRCPVSGVVFCIDEERPAVFHAGHHWFVCCEGCERAARSHPERYLGA